MDFFEHQDRARRQTGRLVLLFALAVVLIVGALNLVVAFLFSWLGSDSGVGADASFLRRVDPLIYVWTTALALLVMLGGTLYRVAQLARGGAAVAEMVGARRVDPATDDVAERRLLHVVEEMAIASGIGVPSVYLMEEPGINAFAAGYSPNEAVVAVTRGALEGLDRDQLQGVVAHEFSHILNGDMRLNIRLLGVLNGILVIGAMGLHILRGLGRGRIRTRGRGSGQALFVLFVLGLSLTAIGFAGVFCARLIKSAVSRQREFLADAAAVQFTRNPSGIAGALKAILMASPGSHVGNRHAEDLSHMFFAEGFGSRLGAWLATHPSLTERIARIEPGLDTGRDRGPSMAETASRVPSLQAASGLAGGEAVSALSAAVVASVGRPGPAQLSYAAELERHLPTGLRDAVKTPDGAVYVCFALLLHPDPAQREAQLAVVKSHYAAEQARSTEAIRQLLEALDARFRLPVLELALPALEGLAEQARADLLAAVQAVIVSDRKVSLAEYVVNTMLKHRLGPTAGRSMPIRYRLLDPLLTDCGLLLSVLAHSSRMHAAAREEAYALAMSSLGVRGATLLAPEDCQPSEVDRSLERLRAAMPQIKAQFLGAGAGLVLADGVVKVPEGELLRALAMVLDCPMPPLLASFDAPLFPVGVG